MVWASTVLFVACGVALMIWRKEAAYLQGMTFGGTVAPGCAIVEAVLLFVLALLFYLGYRAGIFS